MEIYDGLAQPPAHGPANPYLDGDLLYGEDLSDEDIAEWGADNS
jgi:hypothetical protein